MSILNKYLNVVDDINSCEEVICVTNKSHTTCPYRITEGSIYKVLDISLLFNMSRLLIKNDDGIKVLYPRKLFRKVK